GAESGSDSGNGGRPRARRGGGPHRSRSLVCCDRRQQWLLSMRGPNRRTGRPASRHPLRVIRGAGSCPACHQIVATGGVVGARPSQEDDVVTTSAVEHCGDRSTWRDGMTTPTTEFFDDLGRRGHEPLLENLTGSFRFEI